eukprot:SAG11_NODE_7545_length_1130_cov_6.554801_2_plen_84_part_01
MALPEPYGEPVRSELVISQIHYYIRRAGASVIGAVMIDVVIAGSCLCLGLCSTTTRKRKLLSKQPRCARPAAAVPPPPPPPPRR